MLKSVVCIIKQIIDKSDTPISLFYRVWYSNWF